MRQCWSAVSLIGDMWGTLPASPGLVGLFTAICLRSSYYICMSLLNIASAFASVFLLPTHPSPLVSIMVSMSQHLGGCHSQGCHGYALRSAVVHALPPPPATQAPSTKLISHLCGYLKTIIIACISLKHPPDD